MMEIIISRDGLMVTETKLKNNIPENEPRNCLRRQFKKTKRGKVEK